MALSLTPYADVFEAALLPQIADFFGFHAMLITGQATGQASRAALEESRLTLSHWLTPPSALYVILWAEQAAGFLRLCYRGPLAAWIEDIYVSPALRGRGLASGAIAAAEAIVGQTHQAVCMEVAPRNSDALRLYHRLGYTDLSLITLRKELVPGHRDRPVSLLGLEFTY